MSSGHSSPRSAAIRVADEIEVAGFHSVRRPTSASCSRGSPRSHQPVTQREQRWPRDAMQCPCSCRHSVLEPPHQPIEIGGHLQRGRAGRALDAARARDQHLEIVHAAEQVLGLFFSVRSRAALRGGARGRTSVGRSSSV